MAVDERERIARLICGAIHACDPETRMYTHFSGEPRALCQGFFIAPDPSTVLPLWAMYGPAAEAIIADEECRAEERRARYAAGHVGVD